MSLIYAVTMDTFNEGKSIRNAYIIAKGPYDEKTDAQIASDEAVSELADMYKCLESESRAYYTKALEDGTNFLMMREHSNCTPIARFTVFEIDPQKRTSCRRGGISATYKKGSEAQMAEKKKLKKINQYVAAITPSELTQEELNFLSQED